MRRVATILSGSACCVYGLSFTSRFYGARRSVGYVPFNSESLVRGQLFEDIRDAVSETADPANYDAVVVINLCVPTASGVPLDLLPKQINGVRVIGIDVPGFGVPTHAEAKDVLAGAMLRAARAEIEAGPVQRPRGAQSDQPTVAMVGEMFPADPMVAGGLLAPLGLGVAPPTPAREWRDLYGALDCAVVAAIHPFYTAAFREFTTAGRPIVASGPVGAAATETWLTSIAAAAGVPQSRLDAALDASLPALRAVLAANPIRARMTLSGYEGSELLGGRACWSRPAPSCPMSAPPAPPPTGRGRPHLARGARRARAVPRLAGAGPAGDAGGAAGSRHRHHAGRAEGQGAGYSRDLLHQHGVRPSAAWRAGHRRDGADRPRADQRPRAFRAHGVVLRRPSHRRDPCFRNQGGLSDAGDRP